MLPTHRVLRGQLDATEKEVERLVKTIGRLRAENERLTRERDDWRRRWTVLHAAATTATETARAAADAMGNLETVALSTKGEREP